MNMLPSQPGIRPNFVGDWPKIDPAAFVDPSAQIMGNVQIGPDVYVGPLTVIRADEPDTSLKSSEFINVLLSMSLVHLPFEGGG